MPVSAAEHKSVPKHVLFFVVLVDLYVWFTECTDFPRVLKITCCINFCVKYFNRVVVGKNKMEEFCGLNMCRMARR